MERTVRMDILNKWISENGPNGQSRLALNIGISVTTVSLCRRGYAPKKYSTMDKIADFFNMERDELFPFLGKEEVAA